MPASFKDDSGEGWVPPGAIKVSKAALKFARDFDHTVKSTQRGHWVVAFCWSTSVSIKRGPGEAYEEIGAGLGLGAFERHQVPPEFIQIQDGIELVIKVPAAIWENSRQRLIDFDETLLFKLALR